MRFKHIAWDFDGTLYDSYPHIIWAMKKAIEKFGYTDREENIARWVHITVPTAYRHYAPLCGVTPEQLAVEYRNLATGYVSDRVQLYPGIPQLLRDIVAAGGKNYLCTNRKASDGKAYFVRDGVAQYFDFYSGPDVKDGLKSKLEPDLVALILTEKGIAPQDLLMVGDRNLDIESAHAAGAMGCFMDLDGYSTPTCNPEYFAANVEELRKVILG